MDFYERLKAHKALKKLGWKSIGEILSKNDAAIRIAVERKSLSELEKKEINRVLFSEGNYISEYPKNLEEAIEIVVSFQEEALKNKLFNEFVEKMMYYKQLLKAREE